MTCQFSQKEFHHCINSPLTLVIRALDPEASQEICDKAKLIDNGKNICLGNFWRVTNEGMKTINGGVVQAAHMKNFCFNTQFLLFLKHSTNKVKASLRLKLKLHGGGREIRSNCIQPSFCWGIQRQEQKL
eukprot:scaffold140686_cov35-Cyclotella_meneghiniana.AAC.1